MNKVPRSRLLFFSILLITSCGIEQTITLLQAPFAMKTSEGSRTFEFSTPIVDSDRLPNFKGFELYYKLYNDYESISKDKGIDKVSTLTSVTSGFKRINQMENNDKPLIKIPSAYKNQKLIITIDFSTINSVSIKGVLESNIEGGAVIDPIYILRSVVDLNGDYKDFSNINSADDDFLNLSTDQDIYIALYVFSSGISNEYTDIYSEPVSLKDYIPIN